MLSLMLRSFNRAFIFMARFCVCAANLGLYSAIVVFILTRHSDSPRTIWLRCFGRPFTFRGRADKGVMSHFYKSGYRIRDTKAWPVKTIIDGGANIGDETIRFRHFYPEAKIIAIEAAKHNCELLKLNCAGDPLTICLHKGIWPVNSHLKIKTATSNKSFSVFEASPSDLDYDVDAISPLQVILDYNLGNIDILKLDIEGNEYELFTRHIENWIGRVNVLIFECADHERSGSVVALFRNLGTNDFDCFIHGENLVLIRRGTGWRCESTLYY